MNLLDHPRDRPAVIMDDGSVTTYGELQDQAGRIANLLHDHGLRRGDAVALMLPNGPSFLAVAWACQLAGLFYVPVNTHLTRDEVDYILEDSDSKAVFIDPSMPDANRDGLRVVVDSWPALTAALAGRSEAFPEPSQGTEMLYSSGTTGRPKAVRRPLPGDEGSWAQAILEGALAQRYGMTASSVYLCPAPLYHAAGLNYVMAVLRLGATAVVLERFDAEATLRVIQDHRVTHAQFVPTMFVRMLKLPPEVRTRYDLSSLECVLHAAAPCPVDVKRAMFEWIGPIIQEYYGGSEGFAGTMIGPEEWLSHPGSVGLPMTPVHILDDDGTELPTGEPGAIYFEGGPPFEYYKDPAKTASITSAQGWRTLGDVGYVDEDGYLYLTDRATFMIVSGGVNIYPQEAENLLVMHPKVLDAAVFGVPNDEFGEEVKAVVAVTDEAGPEVVDELLQYCRDHLAAYKCPRSVDVRAELPRDPNGKLYKRRLRDQYWAGHSSRIL
jgi:long-chain acyl-CoA synthetase